MDPAERLKKPRYHPKKGGGYKARRGGNGGKVVTRVTAMEVGTWALVVTLKPAENLTCNHVTTCNHLYGTGAHTRTHVEFGGTVFGGGGNSQTHPSEPPCRAQFQADIAERQRIVGSATDWRECARLLRAAGHEDAAIRMALDE